jgi:hypothetical protein
MCIVRAVPAAFRNHLQSLNASEKVDDDNKAPLFAALITQGSSLRAQGMERARLRCTRQEGQRDGVEKWQILRAVEVLPMLHATPYLCFSLCPAFPCSCSALIQYLQLYLHCRETAETVRDAYLYLFIFNFSFSNFITTMVRIVQCG